MIFVDTGIWFSLFVEKEPSHYRTLEWFDLVAEPLATSDYVVDETLTLLLKRNEHNKALKFGKSVIEEQAAILTFVNESQFNRSWILFQKLSAFGLSFTDCTSHIIARELGVNKIASFDRHFLTTGKFQVVP